MAYREIDADVGRMKYSRNPPSHEYIGSLPTSEQAELVSRAKSGDMRAKERITEGLQKLVIGIAKSELRKRGYNPEGDLLEDMIHEGQVGLLKGIEKYDTGMINPKTKSPFAITTYSGWYIMQAIGRALNNEYGKVFRNPIHQK